MDAKNRGPAANTNLPFNAVTSSLSASVTPFGNGVAVKAFAARITACATTVATKIALDTKAVAIEAPLLTLESSDAATHTMDDDDETLLLLKRHALALFNCGKE